MDDKSLSEKLKKYKNYVKDFILNNKRGIEDVHKLRVNSREIFSLISHENPFYKQIKKVIKLSNKVRDLDIFFEEYLHSLPKNILKELDVKNIEKSEYNTRAKDIGKLHIYLDYGLDIPKALEFKYEEKELEIYDIDELEYDHKELHKYRIFIKKRLFKEKNTYPLDKNKIKLLTKIKDLLGAINDNNNGLERLKNYNIDDILFKKIEEFTQKQNDMLFEKFKIVNERYKENEK